MKKWFIKLVARETLEAKSNYIEGLERTLKEYYRDLEEKEAKVRDLERALEVMTEARLNANREVEILRGIVETMKEVNAREVAGLRATIDWFGLESRNRSMFSIREQKEQEIEESPYVPVRRTIRDMTAKFFAEAMEKGIGADDSPVSGPIYSSKAKAEDI